MKTSILEYLEESARKYPDISGYGTLRQARRQQTDEYNLAAGSSDPGEVFEEDK